MSGTGGLLWHRSRPDAASSAAWRRQASPARSAARAIAAKAALDTTAIRIAQNSSISLAPMYACAELLRADGFGEIRFVELAAGTPAINATAQGEVDFAASLPVVPIKAIGAGLPVTVLGGVHVGCYELFAHGAIAGADGKRLWRLARLRGRGFGPVLCGALARGGHGKSAPQKIIADGADWRFLDEVKRELKI